MPVSRLPISAVMPYIRGDIHSSLPCGEGGVSSYIRNAAAKVAVVVGVYANNASDNPEALPNRRFVIGFIFV